jgi:hypothetical protein
MHHPSRGLHTQSKEPSRSCHDPAIWAASGRLGRTDRLGPRALRHSQPTPHQGCVIYKRTGNLRVCQPLLGHSKHRAIPDHCGSNNSWPPFAAGVLLLDGPLTDLEVTGPLAHVEVEVVFVRTV